MLATVPQPFLKHNIKFVHVESDRSEKLYRLNGQVYPYGTVKRRRLELLATQRNCFALCEQVHSAALAAEGWSQNKPFVDRLWKGAYLAARYVRGEADLITNKDSALYRRTATVWSDTVDPIFGRDYYHVKVWIDPNCGRYDGSCSCPDHQARRCVMKWGTGKQAMCKHFAAILLLSELDYDFRDIDGQRITQENLAAAATCDPIAVYRDGQPVAEMYWSNYNAYVSVKNETPANEEALIRWIYQ